MKAQRGKEQRHAHAERGEDFYPTPIEAVRSLLAIEREHLPAVLLEPACGDGAIVKPLRAAGKTVYASDLIDRGCPRSTVADFMAPYAMPPEPADGIVTNPPFKIAPEFVAKALTLAPYCAILARIAFLEGTARKPWFEESPLARVHISSRRLPTMHRDGWEGPKVGSAMAFAWFVWDRNARLVAPEIRWFDWRDHSPRFEDIL